MALTDKNPEVRDHAIFNIEYLAQEGKGDERAVVPLFREFNGRNQRLKHSAAFALAFLGDARVTDYLISRDPRARYWSEDNSLVPDALERIGTPRAVSAAKEWRRQYEEHERDRWEEWAKSEPEE